MKYRIFLIAMVVLAGLFTACKNDNKEKENIAKTKTLSDIPVYNFESFEPLLYTKTNKTYLVNFWAMWCAPCIEELPYLQEYTIKNPDIELILVSMDFPEDIETKLKPFIAKKNITAKVVLLDDPDANTWINKIAPNWSGAIPFTIIFNKHKRFFYERPFKNVMDLENEIYNNFKKIKK